MVLNIELPKGNKCTKNKGNVVEMLRYAPFSGPITRPLLFLSPSLLLVIVAQLVSVVLVFSCSQPVRSF